jgi:hypothetical protein
MHREGTEMSAQQAPALSSAEVTARLRLANDLIARGAVRFAGERMDFEFFCECGDLRCHEVVWLTVAEYRLRRVGTVVAHPAL